MQVGGPFADIDGLEKSSSDGLVNEVLIWLHRAFILLSPSPGNPISISGICKIRTHEREVGKERERNEKKRRDGIHNCLTDLVSIKSIKL